MSLSTPLLSDNAEPTQTSVPINDAAETKVVAPESSTTPDPTAPAAEPTPKEKETMRDVIVKYQLTKWNLMILFVLVVLLIVGLSTPQWYADTCGWSDNSVTFDIHGNSNGGVKDPLIAHAGGGPLACGTIALLMIFSDLFVLGSHKYGFLQQIERKLQQYSEFRFAQGKFQALHDSLQLWSAKKIFVFFGGMLWIAALIAGIGGVTFLTELANYQSPGEEYDGGCLGPGYSYYLYFIPTILLLLLGTYIVVRNKGIPHALCFFFTSFQWLDFLVALGTLVPEVLGGAACFYFLNVCESFCFAHTYKYLQNMYTKETAVQFINRLRLVAPVLTFSISCYHYETRTRTITETDSQGRTHTRTETYTVRVDTYHESESADFDSWEDTSGPLIGLENYNVVKLSLTKHWVCADEHTRSHLQRQQDKLKDRNRHRDTYIDGYTHFEFPGYIERLLCFKDLATIPWWTNTTYYIIFSLLSMSWPFRYKLDAVSVKKIFDMEKSVKKSQ